MHAAGPRDVPDTMYEVVQRFPRTRNFSSPAALLGILSKRTNIGAGDAPTLSSHDHE